jgi:hypothetical protein
MLQAGDLVGIFGWYIAFMCIGFLVGGFLAVLNAWRV